jgi:hypothetical protein
VFWGIQVVDRKSALLGLPGTRERQIPVDADHRDICKFASDEDPRYKLVEDNIAQMVRDAIAIPIPIPIPTSAEQHPNKGAQAGNASRISGQANTVTQAGYANQCVTTGNENKTDQYGEGNDSDVNGSSNITTQVSMGAMGIVLLGIKFILGG